MRQKILLSSNSLRKSVHFKIVHIDNNAHQQCGYAGMVIATLTSNLGQSQIRKPYNFHFCDLL